MSQLFVSGGQSIGVSASTSVLPMNAQDWPPLGWADWISLQSKGLSRVFSNTTVQKHQFFGISFLYSSTLTSIHDHRWLTNTWKDVQHHSLSEKCISKPQWGTISRRSEWLSKNLQSKLLYLARTNLDSILKSRDITLPTKVCYGFSSGHVWM